MFTNLIIAGQLLLNENALLYHLYLILRDSKHNFRILSLVCNGVLKRSIWINKFRKITKTLIEFQPDILPWTSFEKIPTSNFKLLKNIAWTFANNFFPWVFKSFKSSGITFYNSNRIESFIFKEFCYLPVDFLTICQTSII